MSRSASTRSPCTPSGWSAGLAVTLSLLAPLAAASAQVGDPAAGVLQGAGIGTPVNPAEVRDTTLGAPLPSDRAPFTPPATSELGSPHNAPDPVRALPAGVGLRLGRSISLSPYYRGAFFYDSNVFRSSDQDAIEDVELTNTVGIDLTVVRRRLELEAGYAATRREYVDQGLDTTEHRARVRLALAGRTLSTRLRADAALLSRIDNPQFANQATVDRYVYDVGAALAIRLTRTLSLVPEVFGSMEDYQDEDFDFADFTTFGTNVLFAITPRGRVTFFVGGGVRDQLYTDDDAIAPDLRIFSVITGAEVKFLRSLTGQVRLGYDTSQILERRDFAEDEDPPSGMVGYVNLRWQALRSTAFTLDASRQITFTTSSSPIFTTRFACGVEQGLLPNLVVFGRASYEQQDPVEGDLNEFSSIFLTAGTSWELRSWLQLGAAVSYLTRASRATTDGDFDVLRAGAFLTLRY